MIRFKKVYQGICSKEEFYTLNANKEEDVIRVVRDKVMGQVDWTDALRFNPSVQTVHIMIPRSWSELPQIIFFLGRSGSDRVRWMKEHASGITLPSIIYFRRRTAARILIGYCVGFKGLPAILAAQEFGAEILGQAQTPTIDLSVTSSLEIDDVSDLFFRRVENHNHTCELIFKQHLKEALPLSSFIADVAELN